MSLLNERTFRRFFLRNFPDMVFHENALFSVPFDHLLRTICFEENNGIIDVSAGILPLYIHTKVFSGPIFKSVGSFPTDVPDFFLLRSIHDQIKAQAWPLITETKISSLAINEFFQTNEFMNPHLLRFKVYSDVIYGTDSESLRFWVGLLNESIKEFKPSNITDCTMLDEITRFVLLFNDNINTAKHFLHRIEENTLTDLGLNPYLGYKYTDRIQVEKGSAYKKISGRILSKAR